MKANVHSKLMLVCALVMLIALPSISDAAFVTMTAVGQKQGVIKGDNTTKGQEDTIVVLATAFEMKSPRDASSGQATGKIIPGPIGITKNLDRATPPLMSAFVNNENLTSVKIKFYRTSSIGVQEFYFSITLTNAAVTLFSNGGNAQVSSGVKESIELTWQKMELKDEILGVSSIIDWGSSVY